MSRTSRRIQDSTRSQPGPEARLSPSKNKTRHIGHTQKNSLKRFTKGNAQCGSFSFLSVSSDFACTGLIEGTASSVSDRQETRGARPLCATSSSRPIAGWRLIGL
jgi:hypothetical protein